MNRLGLVALLLAPNLGLATTIDEAVLPGFDFADGASAPDTASFDPIATLHIGVNTILGTIDGVCVDQTGNSGFIDCNSGAGGDSQDSLALLLPSGATITSVEATSDGVNGSAPDGFNFVVGATTTGFTFLGLPELGETATFPLTLAGVPLTDGSGDGVTLSIFGGEADVQGQFGFGYELEVTVAPVPVPPAMALYGTALLGAAVWRRRSAQQRLGAISAA